MKSRFMAWLAIAAASFLLPHNSFAVTERVVYSFCQPSCAYGAGPLAGVLHVGRRLYVAASGGGANQWGTLLAVNRKTGAASLLYSFESHYADAATPTSALIDLGGTLYGTTSEGGLGDGGNGAGTIYALNPQTGKVRPVHSFCMQQYCTDGALPESGLLEVNGTFYGTTDVGGFHTTGCYGPYPGCGIVFSFNPAAGKKRVLYSFCRRKACADGSRPFGGLLDVNGILYGTAAEGGTGSGCSDMGEGCGVVFALDPATGAETVLHTFGGSPDGGTPLAGLIYVNGLLYGTTRYGGGYANCRDYQNGCGTVFSVDPVGGTEKTLHVFTADGPDGQYPNAALLAVNGILYGTTEFGGAYGSGTVFSIDLTSGREKVLYSFCSQSACADGANPLAPLVQIDRKLYGTTDAGGSANAGTIFSITP